MRIPTCLVPNHDPLTAVGKTQGWHPSASMARWSAFWQLYCMAEFPPHWRFNSFDGNKLRAESWHVMATSARVLYRCSTRWNQHQAQVARSLQAICIVGWCRHLPTKKHCWEQWGSKLCHVPSGRKLAVKGAESILEKVTGIATGDQPQTSAPAA